jgi:acetyl esterase/lipase
MPKGGTKEEVELLDTAAHADKNFPPAFIMTCEGDFLKAQAPIMKKALDALDVKNEFHCYGSEEKPLWHVFHCDPKLEEAVKCNDDECNFFRSLIK